jgi:arsenate reductase-like glutaredoxin family protein
LLRGRPAQSIYSARSPTAKQLGLNVSVLDDEQMLALMAEHPALIRRPLLAEDGDLVIGFDRRAYEERLDDS